MFLVASSVLPILLVFELGESFMLDGRQGPVVNTTCGPIEGLSQNGAHGFRGIPYALPPVGKLRWQPPKKLNMADGTCWNGTLSAKKYANFCYQYETDTTFYGSEDCLYMNVFTPTLDKAAKLPVMVWVHGGAYSAGSGNDDNYFADEKMSGETNVVYVNHNYRLHTFGFMALQILADVSPTNTSGNYAFMDTLVVLEWVRDNIQNFGGDPSQVTLYGQSAGATHVLALMASPLSKGLFHKGWMASGSPRYDKLAKDAYQDNLVYLKNTKCSTVDCLLALTSQEATEAVPWDDFPNWDMYDQYDIPKKLTRFDGSMAIVDGYVVPEPPFEAFASGFKMDIPFLVGSAGQEMDGATPPSDMGTWSKSNYERFVHQQLDTFSTYIADMTLIMYPAKLSARYQWASMVSDIRVNCGNNLLALMAAKTFTSPVYRYVNTNRPSKPFGDGGGSIYPFHTHDMYAFFGYLSSYLSPLSESDKKFEQNMKNEVISFVRHGHPNTTAWRPFPGSTGLISDTVTTIPEYHAAECEFLFANGFFPYSWRQ
ncbi:para-nitrobenzyl esterase-like [Mercenaria mercenaria]|uniref:para-nitrobenzyl esterase-like n=1 Tax=Mercenaria mercenaria TaxID=6596 RepID=UPI00234E94BA|nr:para-nitrobenzyl esterase-like [Mercenaria mercenaria]XP_045188834.2 para-nitrobenzyl esterase-like [Mercenaria mercenaria]